MIYPYLVERYFDLTYATASMPNGYIYTHPIQNEFSIYQISLTQSVKIYLCPTASTNNVHP